MASKQYTNRVKLWSEQKPSLLKINAKFQNYSAFESRYFEDVDGFNTFFNLMRDQFGFTGDLTDVYDKFACDLDWAKTTKYCGAEPKKETEKTQGQQDKPVEKTISITQQQQNLVAKGYFIGTSGPNKNGVDGVAGLKTQYAQHALDSGIDAVSYNTNYKQQNPDLTQTIENLFGKQEPKQIQTGGQTQGSQNQTGGQTQGSSTQTVTQPQNSLTPQQKAQVQKARVIKTINPNDW